MYLHEQKPLRRRRRRKTNEKKRKKEGRFHYIRRETKLVQIHLIAETMNRYDVVDKHKTRKIKRQRTEQKIGEIIKAQIKNRKCKAKRISSSPSFFFTYNHLVANDYSELDCKNQFHYSLDRPSLF